MKRKGSLFKLEDSCNQYQRRYTQKTQRKKDQHIKTKRDSKTEVETNSSQPVKQNPSESMGRHFDYGQPISLSFSSQAYGNSHFQRSEHDMQQHAFSYPATEYSDTLMAHPFESEIVPDTSAQVPDTQSNLEEETESSKIPSMEPAVQADASDDGIETIPEIPSLDIDEDKAFEDDLKSILTHKKKYDRQQKQMIDIASEDTQRRTNARPSAPKEKMENEHAIFDKISQSMKMANTFDLGSIALEQRFDKFDQELDHEETQKKKS